MTPLIPPTEKSAVESAIENCEMMIEESVEVVSAIKAGRAYNKPSFLGEDYDEAYAQGRKDACRVILISLGVKELGVTSDRG